MTSKRLVFDTLDTYFNIRQGELDIEELRESILEQFDIVQRNTNAGNGKSLLTVNLENSRRSIRSLVWSAFQELVDGMLEYETGNKEDTCTSHQLKSYLAKYGYTLEKALQPVIDEISAWRDALKAGREA